MIARRHIRLKVMQSLYSYFSNPSNEISISEKEMAKDIKVVFIKEKKGELFKLNDFF